MPCWTGSPGTFSDTSCTGRKHSSRLKSGLTRILSPRPFCLGKWWLSHEAKDLGRIIKFRDKMWRVHIVLFTTRKEKAGDKILEHLFHWNPEAVSCCSTSKFLQTLGPYHCSFMPWQRALSRFQSRFRSSGIRRKTSKVLRDSSGFCPQRPKTQPPPCPAIQWWLMMILCWLNGKLIWLLVSIYG